MPLQIPITPVGKILILVQESVVALMLFRGTPQLMMFALTTRGAGAFARQSNIFHRSPLRLFSVDSPGCPKLVEVRKLLSNSGADALVVPSDDPHLSEYVASCFGRREWVSEFSGSAGIAVVTHDEALLWTDGRYFLQAENELGPQWTLMKQGQPGVMNLGDFLASNLEPGSKVTLDPATVSASYASDLQEKLKAKAIALTFTPANIVDKAWGSARPPAPSAPVRIHPIEVAGRTASQKLYDCRIALKEAKADALAVGALDEVAWLLNLRGADVDCNPVFLSFMIVEASGPATLFVESSKLTPEVLAHLEAADVAIEPYYPSDGGEDPWLSALSALAKRGKSVLMDPNRINAAAAAAVPKAFTVAAKTSLLAEAKALKNSAEMAGMLEAHARDGAALCAFFAWLYETVSGPEGRPVSEVEVDKVLTDFRKARGKFLDASFPTIAGADGNGAIVHYRATEGACGDVNSDSMLLLDSGAQYEDGTTDVTRTMHLGQPTEFQKEVFTRVLQGHVGVDTVIFPEGTPGFGESYCLLLCFLLAADVGVHHSLIGQSPQQSRDMSLMLFH